MNSRNLNVKKVFVYFLLASVLNLPAPAQQKQTATSDDRLQKLREFSLTIAKRINFLGDTGNILTRMEETRAVAADYPPDRRPEEYGLLANYLMDYSSRLGNYADAIRYGDFNEQKYPADATPDGKALSGFRRVPAVRAISEAADKSRVIIVNEAHHVPQHRAFTLEMLKALKKKGFKYFAAEALYNSDSKFSKTDEELNRRGYPTKKTGTYTDEPLYGDLIRTALRLGYRVVPYDAGLSPAGQPNKPADRERGAAENLKKRIFETDPQAKVLIHVGYAHNSEAEKVYYDGSKALASFIRELIGIDPLTVDQTRMTEHSAPEYEHPLYRFAAASSRNFDEPSVFQNERKEFWKLPGAGQDITVFSPRSVYVNNRPTWLRLNGARKQYVLPADVCETEKHCLVRARFADESAAAVAVDQIEARTGTKSALLLPRGNFIIESETATGKAIRNWRIRR